MDEKKRKIKELNRESARQSRLKKKRYLEDLIDEKSKLQKANIQLHDTIQLATKRFIEIDSPNKILRAEKSELTERLRSLTSLLNFAQDVTHYPIDIPDIPDFLLQPWPPHPSMASIDVSDYPIDIMETPPDLFIPSCPTQQVTPPIDVSDYAIGTQPITATTGVSEYAFNDIPDNSDLLMQPWQLSDITNPFVMRLY